VNRSFVLAVQLSLHLPSGCFALDRNLDLDTHEQRKQKNQYQTQQAPSLTKTSSQLSQPVLKSSTRQVQVMAGQESSRPSKLRVVTSLSHSGQQGSPISVASSSPTPIATTQPTQTQVSSSSMAPPPQPVVNGTWIQPYGLPANAPPADPHATLHDRQVLANSGVSVMTDYPLSTSPRLTAREINRELSFLRLALGETNTVLPRMKIGAPLVLPEPNFVVPRPDFQAFSWDSTYQPDSAATRARGSLDNVSPRTKPSNKRKHSEMSKE